VGVALVWCTGGGGGGWSVRALGWVARGLYLQETFQEKKIVEEDRDVNVSGARVPVTGGVLRTRHQKTWVEKTIFSETASPKGKEKNWVWERDLH